MLQEVGAVALNKGQPLSEDLSISPNILNNPAGLVNYNHVVKIQHDYST